MVVAFQWVLPQSIGRNGMNEQQVDHSVLTTRGLRVYEPSVMYDDGVLYSSSIAAPGSGASPPWAPPAQRGLQPLGAHTRKSVPRLWCLRHWTSTISRCSATACPGSAPGCLGCTPRPVLATAWACLPPDTCKPYATPEAPWRRFRPSSPSAKCNAPDAAPGRFWMTPRGACLPSTERPASAPTRITSRPLPILIGAWPPALPSIPSIRANMSTMQRRPRHSRFCSPCSIGCPGTAWRIPLRLRQAATSRSRSRSRIIGSTSTGSLCSVPP